MDPWIRLSLILTSSNQLTLPPNACLFFSLNFVTFLSYLVTRIPITTTTKLVYFTLVTNNLFLHSLHPSSLPLIMSYVIFGSSNVYRHFDCVSSSVSFRRFMKENKQNLHIICCFISLLFKTAKQFF